ncbi:hypothetical protein VV02_08960 [Luteipulveratus mongoliensis]|uniref:ABC transporter domain-containing protein n=1 Tax=Luteipulveratus mongoliensis TaxID=571913 RepID=A0A0K1JPY6_9MICO|nr:hypothetical protein VV02_08960 [Luteipulveratus mongoliensis]
MELVGVTRRFGERVVIDELSLRVERGQIVALLGLNGAGKTTTISMILGLLRPDHGDIHVMGVEPRTAMRQGQVGAMLQSARVPPRATVRDVLRLATALYADAMPVPELARLANLEDLIGRRVDRLSGGELQRLRFAVSAAGRPELVILDEPTTAMDVPSRHAFWQQIQAHAAAGMTVLFCTHLLDEVNAADLVYILVDGRIASSGSPAELLETGLPVTVSIDQALDDPSRLPGVLQHRVEGHRTTMTTHDSDRLVMALADAGLVDGLRVVGGDLESAFLQITEQSGEVSA